MTKTKLLVVVASGARWIDASSHLTKLFRIWKNLADSESAEVRLREESKRIAQRNLRPRLRRPGSLVERGLYDIVHFEYLPGVLFLLRYRLLKFQNLALRQANEKCRTPSGMIFEQQFTAMFLHNSPRNGQAQAGAVIFGREK
jgi:hypothetical protein